MVATIFDIPHLRYKKAAYYTALVEGRQQTEFYNFLSRMKSQPQLIRPLGQLNQFIKEIGQKHGAKALHFRHERGAEALPPPYYVQPVDGPSRFGLRLYCIRLTEQVVILLNGALKTHDYPDQCPNCRQHFEFANKLSGKVDEAVREGRLWIDGRNINSKTEDDLTFYW